MRTYISCLFFMIVLQLFGDNLKKTFDFESSGLCCSVLSSTDKTVRLDSVMFQETGNLIIPETVNYETDVNRDIISLKWNKEGSPVEGTYNGNSHFSNSEAYSNSGSLYTYTLECTFRTRGPITFYFNKQIGYGGRESNANTYIDVKSDLYNEHCLSTNGLWEWETITLDPHDEREHTITFYSHDNIYGIGAHFYVYVPYVESGNYKIVSINDNAISGRKDIKEVHISDSIKQIGEQAFSGCPNLRSVYIGKSVETIGTSAFNECGNLNYVKYNAIDCEAPSIFGNSGSKSITGWTLDIGKDVSKIPSSFCLNAEYLDKVESELVCGCNFIEENAFKGCSRLSEFVISPNLCAIEGEETFYGCSKLGRIYNYSNLNIHAGYPNHGYVAFYADDVITADRKKFYMYSLQNSQRGGGYIKASDKHNYITTTTKEGISFSSSDLNSLWIRISKDDNHCLLYNVGRKMFLSNTSGGEDASNSWMIVSSPQLLYTSNSSSTSITIQDTNYMGDYDFLNAYVDTDYGTCNYNADDGGSLFTLKKVCEVSEELNKEIIGMFLQYYTGFEYSKDKNIEVSGSMRDMKSYTERNVNALLRLNAEPEDLIEWPKNIVLYKNGEEDQASCLEIKDANSIYNPFVVNSHEINYTRTFTNANWQALYVPFEIPVDTLTQYGMEVAKLNDTHMYDWDEDGAFEEVTVEFLKLKSGMTKANHPYLVKASEAGTISFTLKDAMLEAAAETSVDCSTIEQQFTFTGIYSGVGGDEVYANNYYFMSGGKLCRAANETVSLKPQRWYMTIENRDHSDVVYYAPSMRLVIDGELQEPETTGIERVTTIAADATLYTLDGRKVMDGSPKPGMYVQNGKKLIIK